MTPRVPTLLQVLDAVCEHYSIAPEDMLGRGRRQSIAHPRQLFMFLARECTPLGVAEVGRLIDRHHTIVSRARQTVKDRMRHDAHLELVARTLKDRLTREPQQGEQRA